MAQSKQWIDKQYDYNSLLNVPYGSTINFNGDLVNLHMDIYLPNCDDATHTAMIDQPEKVYDVISRFLKQVESNK